MARAKARVLSVESFSSASMCRLRASLRRAIRSDRLPKAVTTASTATKARNAPVTANLRRLILLRVRDSMAPANSGVRTVSLPSGRGGESETMRQPAGLL